jgi:non-homologous end joining protein Ku
MIERLKEMDKQPDIAPEIVKHEPEVTDAEDKKDAIIKKIMGLLKKKKTIKKEASAIVDPKTTSGALGDVVRSTGASMETVQDALRQAQATGDAVTVYGSKTK